MLKVGLTGGIGSGKSEVSRRFEELGAPVIDTDVLAREVVEPDAPALGALVEAFGRSILADDGTLDRARLRDIVFADADARERVEGILHPAIRERLDRRLAELARDEAPYVIIVVPLLVETDFHERVDRVLTVEAPRERRIQWVMERSGMSREEVEKIMDTQATSEERMRMAKDILHNESGLEVLRASVDRLHAKYLVVPPLVK